MNTSIKRVLVVGELNVDLIMNRLNKLPELGKEQRAEDMELVLGSSSAIFASNLAKLGSQVSFCGKVGEDHFGNFIKSELESNNINIRPIITDSTLKTGITVAFNQNNERMMVTYPGAMEHFRIDDIDTDLFENHHHLHVAAIFFQPRLKSTLTDLFRSAQMAGLTTSLDTQWDPSENWDLDLKSILPYVNYFMPNEQELLNLTKKSNIDDAVESLSDYMHTLIIKRGVRGARLIQNHEILDTPAYTVPSFKDAIGAGDSFNAGFIYAILNEQSLKDALYFGSKTAAVSTMVVGGTGAIQSAEQVLRESNSFSVQHN